MNDIKKIVSVSAGHLYLASSFEDVFWNVQSSLTKPLEQVVAEETELLRTLQGESSNMPQRHSFCDQGFRLRHCSATTEASIRFDAIQDWRCQSRENKQFQATISRRDSPIVARGMEMRVNQVRILHAHRGQSARDNEGWCMVWHRVPQELVTDTRALVLTLVCSAVSQFDMRIVSRAFACPALLLILPQKKPRRFARGGLKLPGASSPKEACCVQNEKDDLTEDRSVVFIVSSCLCVFCWLFECRR